MREMMHALILYRRPEKRARARTFRAHDTHTHVDFREIRGGGVSIPWQVHAIRGLRWLCVYVATFQ